MIALVLDKLADNNAKIAKQAEKIVKDTIMTGGYFDYNLISSFILSEKSYLNIRFINSDKHVTARLELMSYMIDTSDQHTSKKPFPMSELIEYVIAQLSHSNKSIRKETLKIIAQMYEKVGWYALEAHIARDVPQNQLQFLVKKIPEIESLIKKKETNKGSESLREALKAVKEASQSVANVEPPKGKENTNKNSKPKEDPKKVAKVDPKKIAKEDPKKAAKEDPKKSVKEDPKKSVKEDPKKATKPVESKDKPAKAKEDVSKIVKPKAKK